MKRLDLEAEKQETISKYEVLITNLQRTLDFQEHDNDHETIQKQRLEIDKHDRDVVV